jgi:hypothetical protein|tara:strand:- start:188 stop:307 length:120 start_codon:yes stop_codon:yes gene_type:complete
MKKFDIHTIETAPKDSKEILEKVQAQTLYLEKELIVILK